MQCGLLQLYGSRIPLLILSSDYCMEFLWVHWFSSRDFFLLKHARWTAPIKKSAKQKFKAMLIDFFDIKAVIPVAPEHLIIHHTPFASLPVNRYFCVLIQFIVLLELSIKLSNQCSSFVVDQTVNDCFIVLLQFISKKKKTFLNIGMRCNEK